MLRPPLFATLLLLLCACGDSEPELDVSRVYLLSAMETPKSAGESSELALDLDDDGRRENLLGDIYGAIRSSSAGPIPSSLEWLYQLPVDSGYFADAVVAGEIGIELEVLSADVDRGGDALVRASLSGAEASEDIVGQILEVDADRYVLATQAGPMHVALGLFGEPEYVVSAPGTLRLEWSADGTITDCKMAVGLSPDQIREVLLPAWYEAMESLSPCDTSACSQARAQYVNHLDADGDDEVSESEFRAAEIDVAMLSPDVDLLDEEGALEPGNGSEADSVSFSFGCELAPQGESSP